MAKISIDWQSFKEKYIRPKKNQFPTGTRVYKGFQGSGKTLSMAADIFQCRKIFPDCLVYSNLRLKGIKYYPIDNSEDLKKALTAENGEKGVLVCIDEAHLFFNKKDGISLDVITCISQQRKDRRKIFFTCQIWEDLDVSLRKQVKEVVCCRKIGRLQLNKIIDGETIRFDKQLGTWTGVTKEYRIFKHNERLYNAYNTYQKIINNREYERTANTPIYYEDLPVQRKKIKLL